MSAASRRERARKRARRARRREEVQRRIGDARRAREERLARLGPLVDLYGEGSEVLRAVDRLVSAQGDDFTSSLVRRPMARLEKRICRPDGTVTYVRESCGFRFETTFAGGRGAEVDPERFRGVDRPLTGIMGDDGEMMWFNWEDG